MGRSLIWLLVLSALGLLFFGLLRLSAWTSEVHNMWLFHVSKSPANLAAEEGPYLSKIPVIDGTIGLVISAQNSGLDQELRTALAALEEVPYLPSWEIRENYTTGRNWALSYGNSSWHLEVFNNTLSQMIEEGRMPAHYLDRLHASTGPSPERLFHAGSCMIATFYSPDGVESLAIVAINEVPVRQTPILECLIEEFVHFEFAIGDIPYSSGAETILFAWDNGPQESRVKRPTFMDRALMFVVSTARQHEEHLSLTTVKRHINGMTLLRFLVHDYFSRLSPDYRRHIHEFEGTVNL